MATFRRCFRLSVGLLRLAKEKLWNGKALQLEGIHYFIGHNTKILTKPGVTCKLGRKTWLSDNCYFSANGGSIQVGSNNYFNTNCKVVCMDEIQIGSNNLFGPNVVIVDHNHRYSNQNELICNQGYEKKRITIGSDIWIGANVTICAGVTICDKVVIGANSVVTKTINEPGVYVGIPAKKVK